MSLLGRQNLYYLVDIVDSGLPLLLLLEDPLGAESVQRGDDEIKSTALKASLRHNALEPPNKTRPFK